MFENLWCVLETHWRQSVPSVDGGKVTENVCLAIELYLEIQM